MPRTPRKKSSSDIYHVMLRGINRQAIFEDEEDFRRFLFTLTACKQTSGFKLYAYCLMPNHIHLLLHVQSEPLDLIIKRIGSRFVFWYNRKYERCGHLFQDRYKSEPVEDDSYFLTVLRYILQNPMKAGLESSPGAYRWSSYPAYVGKNDCLTDTDYANGYFSSRAELLAYLCQKNEDRVMDAHPRRQPIPDSTAAFIAAEITGELSQTAIRKLDVRQKLDMLSRLRQRGLSIAQITRATGIPVSTIYRMIQ